MEYDYEVMPFEWKHLEYPYRAVYHLGYSGNMSANTYMWTHRIYGLDSASKEVQDANHQKFRDLLDQLMGTSYVMERSAEGIVHVYFHEWIDEAVLRLSNADEHFTKPAVVEKLYEG